MKAMVVRFTLIFLMSFSMLAVTCSPEVTKEKEVVPQEIPDGWNLYNERGTDISFYYPSEWGEVIDYIDYFQKLITKGESKELSREEEKQIEDFKSVIEDSGKYLAFSNLDMDWLAHIRITSIEQIQSFVSYCNST